MAAKGLDRCETCETLSRDLATKIDLEIAALRKQETAVVGLDLARIMKLEADVLHTAGARDGVMRALIRHMEIAHPEQRSGGGAGR